MLKRSVSTGGSLGRIAAELALLVAALCGGAISAAAAPLYSYTIDYPVAEQQLSQPSPVQSQQGPDYFDFGNESGSSTARAAAGYGYLEGYSDVVVNQAQNAAYSGVSVTAQESSEFYLDDIQLSGPANTTVYFTLTVEADGDLLTAVTGPDYAATAEVSATLHMGDLTTGTSTGATIGSATDSTVVGSTATGLFANCQAGRCVEIASDSSGNPLTLTGRSGDMVSVDLTLATYAIAGYSASLQNVPPGTANATANFGNTESLPTSGLVFNFYDGNGNPVSGWTANSASGCIADNQFVCAIPTGLPEPSATALVGLGAALLAIERRRRPAFEGRP